MNPFSTEICEIIDFKGLEYQGLFVQPKYAYNGTGWKPQVARIASELGVDYWDLYIQLENPSLFVYALYKLKMKDEEKRLHSVQLLCKRLILNKGLKNYFGHYKFY